MLEGPVSEENLHLEEDEHDVRTEESGETKLRQADTYWSWIVCLAGIICNIIVLGSSYSYGILFSSLLDEFKKGKSVTAWVGSSAIAASGLFGPVAGRLIDRFNARAVVISGALLCVGGLFLTSLVPDLYLLFLTYGGMYGFGSCLVYISCYVIVPKYFVKRRSLAIGLVTVSTGATLLVMGPVTQALKDAFGWRGAFRGLGCTVIVVFFLRWVLDPRVAIDESEKAAARSSPQTPKSKILDFSMWRNATFVVFTVSTSVTYIGQHIPTIHLGKFCESLGISEDSVSWLYSSIGAASLLARIPGSKLCDMFGPQRVFQVSAIMGGIGAMLFPLATNLVWLFCLSILHGLGDGLLAIGMILGALNILTIQQKAQGYGFFQLCISIALLCGPAIGGLIADKTNDYHATFFFAGGIKILGVLILIVYNCLRRKELSQEKTQASSEKSIFMELLVVEKITVL
ncbi:monocarboxylate transporter 4-like [Stylophora pistillata]|uniref:monocarboxylate transporter 4-like n=1 Tax=Stylophora pistillata TaxID=50429 RepID=UPI000C051F66|nr:monocarboxylate transporter 4-like [Stylophora pistillata]XP_022801747.1 monocarboxylate transporter 4-like [Stylophora pistillata]XP_022801748.1 monocarboxylate transporter 4-like [Stylophora pistillata]